MLLRLRLPAIFLLALAIRISMLHELSAIPFFRTPQLDSLEYLEWAQYIAHGGTWPGPSTHGPGYPMFLALLLTIFGGSLKAVHIVQAMVGSGTACLVSLIGTRLYGTRAGMWAGVVAAGYGPLVFIDLSILSEGFLLFLLALALFLVVREPSRPMAFVAGAVIGVAIVVRPTAAVILPIALWQIWQRSNRSSIHALMVLVGVACAVVPVITHMWLISGGAVVVQTQGGMNAYIGNSPLHDGTGWGRPGGSWDWIKGAAWRAGIREGAAEDRFYVRLLMDEVRSRPGGWLRLIASKLLWIFQAEEIRDAHSFAFIRERSLVARFAPGFGVLLSFGVVGCEVLIRKKTSTRLLFASFLAMLLTVVGLLVGMRYRLPIVLPLFVFAGVAICSVIDCARRRHTRHLLAYTCCWVIVWLFTHIRVHAPTHNFAEEWAMNGISLRKEGRTPAALASIRTALELDPRLGFGWRALGDIFMYQGRWAEAEAAYRHSIQVDPHHSRAYAHLAIARVQQGDRAAVAPLLRQALAIRFDDEALHNLVRVLIEDGKVSEAERLLRTALEVDDRDVAAWLGMMRIAMMRGRPDLAHQFLGFAEVAAPGDPEVRRWRQALERGRTRVRDSGPK